MGGKKNAYRLWVGKPEGRGPLRRTRSRCESKGGDLSEELGLDVKVIL
jgi:hypothetical protein